MTVISPSPFWQATLRDIETEAALDDAEIRNLELQLQKKAFEQELMRGHMEASQKHREDIETHRIQRELDDKRRRQVMLADRGDQAQFRRVSEKSLGLHLHV